MLRSVRQWSILAHEEARGLTVEMDTLTVGGSPVIKRVFRIRNTTTIAAAHRFAALKDVV